jgi:hypothetical protein
MIPASLSALASVCVAVLTALAALPAAAAVELNPSHPETYVVQPGDTLWGIAGRFLREPWQWRKIWQANSDIRNPDQIFPGDVLRLTYRNGEPRVRLERGMRTVKLSPRVRVTQLQQPVPTIPIGIIRPFLTRAYVLDKAEMDAAPYVVDFPDEHIVGGLHDSAYVRSMYGTERQHFAIVRPGEALRDPGSKDILGYKGQFVADAVLERPGDPAKLKLQTVAMETAIGDRVIAAGDGQQLQSFVPRPAPKGLRGRIISVLNGVSQIGQYNVVVLNRGTTDGVEVGQVFAVYNGGEQGRDLVAAGQTNWDWKNQRFWSQETWFGDYRVQGWVPDNEPGPGFPTRVAVERPSSSFMLPFEKAGIVLVFHTFRRVSFALVMKAARPMHMLDTVRSPGS